MTTVDVQNQPKWRGVVLLLLRWLGLATGLGAVFALVVTAALAWVEHVQAQWPQVTARVQRCGLDIYTHDPETYWIDCSIGYVVRGEEIMSHVHSRSTPAPQRVIWQYPARQFDKQQEWVDAHPEGIPIVVHYDPANYKKAVLVTTDMPLGGPQTPSNLKVLGFFAVSCAVLLAIARIVQPVETSRRSPGSSA